MFFACKPAPQQFASPRPQRRLFSTAPRRLFSTSKCAATSTQGLNGGRPQRRLFSTAPRRLFSTVPGFPMQGIGLATRGCGSSARGSHLTA